MDLIYDIACAGLVGIILGYGFRSWIGQELATIHLKLAALETAVKAKI